MPKQYLASVFKESKINEDDYIYSAEKVVEGTIDEKTRNFITASGEKYSPIRYYKQSEEANDKYYGNFIEVERIVDTYGGNCTYDEAVKLHEARCKDIIFYKIKIDDKNYIIITIDKKIYLNRPTLKKIISENTNDPKKKASYINATDQYIETLKDLVGNLVISNYTIDELLDLQNKLLVQKKEIANVIDSVNMKINIINDEEEAFYKKRGVETSEEFIKSPEVIEKPQSHQLTDTINITETFNQITKTLIAQDEPARRLIVELSRLDEMRKKDYGIMLTGDSGSGKTLLMSLLAKHMNRPLLKIDSTQLTAPGYVGKDIEQYLWELYESCDADLSKAERAIVFFDEIDKKGSEKKSDISGQAVLNTLLTFIGGTTYTACKNPRMMDEYNSIKIDTSNMLVVAGGAFLDVYNSEKETSIGFNNQSVSIEKEPEISDFVDKAMIPKELMGRLPIIIKLNSLDIDSIRKILLESDESVLKLQEEVFNKRGVKLTTQDGYILSASQKAIDRKIGARGLNKIITDSTWLAYEDVATNPDKYEEIILTEKTIEDPKQYIKIPKKQN